MITRISAASAYVSGAHLVDPSQGLNGPADLLVEKGRVLAVDKPGKLRARAKAIKAEAIEADGLFLAPGFVDLHCRIHEPGAEHIEGFATGSASAAAGGFTTLLVQPVMPESAGKLLGLLGQAESQRAFSAIGERLVPGTALPPPTGVFPRYQPPSEAE